MLHSLEQLRQEMAQAPEPLRRALNELIEAFKPYEKLVVVVRIPDGTSSQKLWTLGWSWRSCRYENRPFCSCSGSFKGHSQTRGVQK